MSGEEERTFQGYPVMELLPYVNATRPERRPFTCQRTAEGVASPEEAKGNLAAGFTEYFGDDDWQVDWADAVEIPAGGFAVTVQASYDPDDKKRRVAASYWSERMRELSQSAQGWQ